MPHTPFQLGLQPSVKSANLLSAAELAPPEGARVLFSQPIPVDPANHRTGLIVAVRKLHLVLPALLKAGARLEHVYDC